MNYQEKRKMADNRISKNGKLLTLRYPGSSSGWVYAYDPILGDTWTLVAEPHTVVYTNPSDTSNDYAVYGVELSYTDKDYDGERIKIGDRKFMVSALSDSGIEIPKPNVGGTLFVGTSAGTALTIVTVEPFMPGDMVIYYMIQARG